MRAMGINHCFYNSLDFDNLTRFFGICNSGKTNPHLSSTQYYLNPNFQNRFKDQKLFSKKLLTMSRTQTLKQLVAKLV